MTALKTQAKKVLNHPKRRRLKHIVLRALFRGNLPKLALAFGTDKHGAHFYAGHYQHHFQHLRHKQLNLLEIGIGGYQNPKHGGESLRMWKAYFTRANIFGIDIHDKTPHDESRIKTFMGSQVDEDFLRKVTAEIGDLDIVIDDGSHLSEHVVTTFSILFPLLKPNGIYAIEDLQTSYWDEFKGVHWGGSRDVKAPHTSMNFLKSLVDGLNHQEFLDEKYAPTYFDRNITAIHFYHNLAFICKGANNEGSNVVARVNGNGE